MRNGTQEELDAAREDATKLPFDAVFRSKFVGNVSHPDLPDGVLVTRGNINAGYCDENEVAFSLLDYSDYWYMSAVELEPIND